MLKRTGKAYLRPKAVSLLLVGTAQAQAAQGAQHGDVAFFAVVMAVLVLMLIAGLTNTSKW